MGFSNGVYSRTYNWQNDANAGIDILPARMDTEDNGFASGLSTCILKDGTQTVTANIPFGGFRLTGTGAATARTDAIQAAQVQDGGVTWVGTIGGTNTYTASTTPTFTAYVAGQRFSGIVTNGNTLTSTINLNSIGARTYKKVTRSGLANLASGDIPAGATITWVDDGTNAVIQTIALGSAASKNLNTVIVDDGSGNLIIAAGQVTEAMQVLADNTTANVSTSKHGYAPKSPNDATKFLDGTGAYSVPSAPQLQHNTVTATGAFTFTTPSNITTSTVFKLILTAGGGGGAGSSGVATKGGSGGETIMKWITGLSPSTGYSGVIGTGGSAGSTGAGGDGADSTFTVPGPTTYTAHKGLAGAATSGAGPLGGTGGNGDINIPGGNGGNGYTSTSTDKGGAGGGTWWGPGSADNAAASGAAGVDAVVYGTGGSAGGSSNTGGAGKSGIAHFEWIS